MVRRCSNESHSFAKCVVRTEKLKRKDAEIRNSLEQKRALVAEILHVPSSDFETIADMAAHAHETSGYPAPRDAQEIVVAAVGQGEGRPCFSFCVVERFQQLVHTFPL